MKTYLLRLTAAAILAALIRKLAPKSGAGRGARLGAGLLVLVCLVSPLGKLNLGGSRPGAGTKRLYPVEKG